MIEFESSVIRRVEYDDDNRALDVHFDSGRAYRYSNVPPEVVDWWLKVDSKLGFFARKIRDEYAWTQLTAPGAGEEDLTELLKNSLKELSEDD